MGFTDCAIYYTEEVIEKTNTKKGSRKSKAKKTQRKMIKYKEVDYRVVATFDHPLYSWQLIFPRKGKFPNARDEWNMGPDPIIIDTPYVSCAAIVDVTKVGELPTRFPERLSKPSHEIRPTMEDDDATEDDDSGSDMSALEIPSRREEQTSAGGKASSQCGDRLRRPY